MPARPSAFPLRPVARGARAGRAALAACSLTLALACSAAAEELLIERRYRLEAQEVTVDLERRQARARGQARLSHDDLQFQADTLEVNWETKRAAAAGNVVVSQVEGELTAAEAEYDLEARTGRLTEAAGHADGVYFRAESLSVTPQRWVLNDAWFTTCDVAERPHYRVSAEQILLLPGERLSSRRAAVWYGDRRLLRLPNWSVSLRPARPVSPLVPLGGFGRRDGAYAGVRYTMLTAPASSGSLEARYTTSRGVRALGRAEARTGWGAAAVNLSRRSDLLRSDLGLFAPGAPLSDVTLDRLPEVELSVNPVSVGGMVNVSGRVAWGEYREAPGGARASRLVGDLYLEGRPLKVGGARVSPVFGLRGLSYDRGQRRSAIAYGLVTEIQPSADLALRLGYLERDAHGSTPFAFDGVELSREAALGLAWRPGREWRVETVARRDLEQGSFAALEVAVIRVAHCLEYGVTWRRVGGLFGLHLGLAEVGPMAAPGW